jgi:hypothetical protein
VRNVELELYRRSTHLEKPIVLTLEEPEDIVSFLQALTGPAAGERAGNSAESP